MTNAVRVLMAEVEIASFNDSEELCERLIAEFGDNDVDWRILHPLTKGAEEGDDLVDGHWAVSNYCVEPPSLTLGSMGAGVFGLYILRWTAEGGCDYELIATVKMSN